MQADILQTLETINRNYMTTEKKSNWGGARPGAGRKPKEDKRVQVTAYVTPKTAELIASLDKGERLGRIVDKIAEHWPDIKKIIDF